MPFGSVLLGGSITRELQFQPVEFSGGRSRVNKTVAAIRRILDTGDKAPPLNDQHPAQIGLPPSYCGA